MSARVYFVKTVKDCKDVSITYLQEEQLRRPSLLCLYTAIFLFYSLTKYNRIQLTHKQTNYT